jgi:hypothetical protein
VPAQKDESQCLDPSLIKGTSCSAGRFSVQIPGHVDAEINRLGIKWLQKKRIGTIIVDQSEILLSL